MHLKPDIFIDISIPTNSIIIEEKAILNWLGYDQELVEPFIRESIQKRIGQTKYLIQPKGTVTIKTLDNNSGIDLTIGDTIFKTGKIISGQLKHAENIAFFITTIGKEIEMLSNELFNQNEMLDGYIVNLIGSEAAEACAEYIHQHISNNFGQDGLKVTNRFSPGYCNWDVSEQFKLFSQFQEKCNYVKLTESALMEPVKSVSGIFGIGQDVKYLGYKCAICDDKKCLYRKNR